MPDRGRTAVGADVPARIAWAVALVDPQPDERILEIGAGPGVAAALVCDRLTTGRLLAVDRSAVAVDRNARRNSQHVESGRLSVQKTSLAALEVAPASFDKAFAINVNVFWVADPRRELEVLSRALRPGGTLYALYGAEGSTSGDRITSLVARSLAEHGFTDVMVVTADSGLGATGRRAVSA